MKETSENRKDNLISAGATVTLMVLVIVLLLSFGLKSMIPPPPPKKTFYVELDAAVGGGGGGGMDVPTPNNAHAQSSPNYATQNAQDAPAVSHAPKTSATTTTTSQQPKIDQGAIYKGGKGGSGSGGGSGNGIGTGDGNGLGPGKGDGVGGGIGYGKGDRSMVQNINTKVNEEGQVAVEVHVMADGTVSEAHVINRMVNGKDCHTTITNREIQAQCVREAKKAKYKPGKEELRVIVFK